MVGPAPPVSKSQVVIQIVFFIIFYINILYVRTNLINYKPCAPRVRMIMPETTIFL